MGDLPSQQPTCRPAEKAIGAVDDGRIDGVEHDRSLCADGVDDLASRIGPRKTNADNGDRIIERANERCIAKQVSAAGREHDQRAFIAARTQQLDKL